ncbi:MAG: hypothetical protein J6R41_10415, partial [Paludibacteraceae bacterium]|nr:hypothetical protein [Paludibacteraceae bacterium]
MGTEKKIRRALFTILLSIIAVTTHAATLTTSQQSACVDDLLDLNASGFSTGVEYAEFQRSTDGGATWQLVRRVLLKDGAATTKDVMENADEVLYKVSAYKCNGGDSSSEEAACVVTKAEGCEINTCESSSVIGGYNGSGTNFNKIDVSENVNIVDGKPTNIDFNFEEGTGFSVNMNNAEVDDNGFFVFPKNGLIGEYTPFTFAFNCRKFCNKPYVFSVRFYLKPLCTLKDLNNDKVVSDQACLITDSKIGSVYTSAELNVYDASSKKLLKNKSWNRHNGQLQATFGDVVNANKDVKEFMIDINYEVILPDYSGRGDCNCQNEEAVGTIDFKFNQISGQNCNEGVLFSLDYVSAYNKAERVCFAPYDVACVGDRVCAEYVGAKPGVEQEDWKQINLPSGKNYQQKTKTTRVWRWYNEDDNGVYQMIDEDIVASDVNPLCRIVNKEGKDRYRLEVVESIFIERQNFNSYNNGEEKPAASETIDDTKTFNFYVVGEDCSSKILCLKGPDFLCKPGAGNYELLLSRDNSSLNYTWEIEGNPDGINVVGNGSTCTLTTTENAVAGTYILRAYPANGSPADGLTKEVEIGELTLKNVPVLNYCTESAPLEDEVVAHIKNTIGDNYEVTVANYNGADGAYTYTATANGCSANGTVEVSKAKPTAPEVTISNYCYGTQGSLPTLPSGVDWVGGEPNVSASVAAGTHDYSYRFTDPNGCVSDDVTKSFTVYAKAYAPKLSVENFCEGTEGTLSGSTDNVEWENSTAPALGADVKAGTYNYSYTYTDGNGCKVDSTLTFKVYAKAYAPKLSVENFCEGTEGTLSGSTDNVEWENSTAPALGAD